MGSIAQKDYEKYGAALSFLDAIDTDNDWHLSQEELVIYFDQDIKYTKTPYENAIVLSAEQVLEKCAAASGLTVGELKAYFADFLNTHGFSITIDDVRSIDYCQLSASAACGLRAPTRDNSV